MIRWVTAFLDTPAAVAVKTEEFWLAVTSSTASERRGNGTFVSLLPAVGDSHVRAQVIDSDAPGVHLDLCVEDVQAAAEQAIELGARRVFHEPGLEVLRSPGGLPFCFDTWAGQATVPPSVLVGGATTRLDQVCIDIPTQVYDAERAFWAAVTGWEAHAGALPEFEWLTRPEHSPIRLLLQRTGAVGPVRAHIDLAAGPTMDHVAQATRAHVTLGAEPGERHTHWQVLTDPAGRAYCLTARDPQTGRLAI